MNKFNQYFVQKIVPQMRNNWDIRYEFASLATLEKNTKIASPQNNLGRKFILKLAHLQSLYIFSLQFFFQNYRSVAFRIYEPVTNTSNILNLWIIISKVFPTFYKFGNLRSLDGYKSWARSLQIIYEKN